MMSSKLMIEAERRFPVRIRIGVPPKGLGGRLDQMRAWLDGNCGADGWALTPSGMRGVLNDALSIYFLDPTLAGAFVARWCVGYKVEAAEGVFRVRDDEPTPRGGASSDAVTGAVGVTCTCCPSPAMALVLSRSMPGNAFRSRLWSASRGSSVGVGGAGP
jgi:hypothetical protein